MDVNRVAVKLCIKGTQAEFAGRIDEARALYWQAWEAAEDDYEACIAAHYVAHHQLDPQAVLHWHQEALARAEAVGDDRIIDFYPSLYVNLARAYEVLGHLAEANHYYQLAADLGLVHQANG